MMLSGPAIRTFFQISRIWRLTEEEEVSLLGLTCHGTLHAWKREAPSDIEPDTLERISYILGIYKGINMLLPEERANAWMHAPNAAPVFGGVSALERMTKGDISDLAVVRQFIDAQRS